MDTFERDKKTDWTYSEELGKRYPFRDYVRCDICNDTTNIGYGHNEVKVDLCCFCWEEAQERDRFKLVQVARKAGKILKKFTPD